MPAPTAVAPFGPSTPAVANAPPASPPSGARFIDSMTKDYAYGPDGEYQRMPITRQRVLLAVTTLKDSSTVTPKEGIDIPRRMGTSWERKTEIETARVLQPMLKDGSMRLHFVKAERTSLGRSLVTISYTDLATGQRDSISVAG